MKPGEWLRAWPVVAIAVFASLAHAQSIVHVRGTASPGPDGTLVAAEVHYLPPTVAEGHTRAR